MQTAPTVRLAPDVPDLAALGAREPGDLLADPPRVETAARIEPFGAWLRVPLPGTPDRTGRQHERPRGAGTGYLWFKRFGAGAPAWRARFTHPRSTSLAAREWNLACHLQAAGVTTPQLAALIEAPGIVTADASVLIVRELEGFVPLRPWLASERDAARRANALESLALALGAALRCGAWLPRTDADNLMLQARDSDDCVALQLTNLGSEQAILRERGLVRARLPAIAFTDLGEGRIRRQLAARARSAWLAGLQRELAPVLRPGESDTFAGALSSVGVG